MASLAKGGARRAEGLIIPPPLLFSPVKGEIGLERMYSAQS